MTKPSFAKSVSPFYPALRTRVKAYLDEHKFNGKGGARLLIKAALIFIAFLAGYYALVFVALPWYVVLALCVYMGFATAAIGFNVMHDAAHGSFSKRRWVNEILGYSCDFVGASVALWRTKHNVIHHTYTNVPEWDGDVEQEAIIRLTPEQPHYGLHRFQHLYSLPIYGLLTLTWVFFADFEKLVKKRIAKHPLPPMSRKDLTMLWGMKLFHLGYTLVLPSFFHPFWQVLLCYLLIHFVLGILLAMVFQLAHVYEETNYPMPSPESLQLENEWALHQVATTANFATRARLLNWFVGGLNFQVEHHLFPAVSHIHYPALNRITRDTCTEYGVRYREFPTLRAAVRAHFRQLYMLGRG